MTCGSALDDVCCVFNFFQPCIDDMALHMQACLSSNEFSANGAGIGLIRNCSAALVPVLADKMEQLFQCVVMPTYAMSESRSDCRKICLKESQVEKFYIRNMHEISTFEDLETVFDEFSSCDRGMPIASNPLPPNLRVLRSVGQAAGPQMVLRHEENNSEPKQGSEPATRHMKII